MNLTAISQRHLKNRILKKETKNGRNKLLLLLTRELKRRREKPYYCYSAHHELCSGDN